MGIRAVRATWHLAYLRSLFAHKVLVLREGRKLGVPLVQLLAHDLSKLTPAEYHASVRFAHAPRPLTEAETADCERALNVHRRRNRHHPEYWTDSTPTGDGRPAPMPDRYRREMLADWRAVGSAKRTPTAVWYSTSFDRRKLHPDTRGWIEDELGV